MQWKFWRVIAGRIRNIVRIDIYAAWFCGREGEDRCNFHDLSAAGEILTQPRRKISWWLLWIQRNRAWWEKNRVPDEKRWTLKSLDLWMNGSCPVLDLWWNQRGSKVTYLWWEASIKVSMKKGKKIMHIKILMIMYVILIIFVLCCCQIWLVMESHTIPPLHSGRWS